MYDEDLEWYPARNFIDSPHKIRDLHTAYQEIAGPPKR